MDNLTVDFNNISFDEVYTNTLNVGNDLLKLMTIQQIQDNMVSIFITGVLIGLLLGVSFYYLLQTFYFNKNKIIICKTKQEIKKGKK